MNVIVLAFVDALMAFLLEVPTKVLLMTLVNSLKVLFAS